MREWRVGEWYDAWRVAMDKPCYHMWDGLLLGVRLYTILKRLIKGYNKRVLIINYAISAFI